MNVGTRVWINGLVHVVSRKNIDAYWATWCMRPDVWFSPTHKAVKVETATCLVCMARSS